MEKAKLGKILSMIKQIERINLEFEKYLSNLEIISRDNMLKEIVFDIIKDNKIFQELQISDEGLQVGKDVLTSISYYNLLEEIISKIQNDPSQKEHYLREFFSIFDEISENDKKVLTQSLIEKDIEYLNRELNGILKIFKTKDLE